MIRCKVSAVGSKLQLQLLFSLHLHVFNILGMNESWGSWDLQNGHHVQ